MRVAFLASSYLNPQDPKSWSGLPYFMKRSLEGAGIEPVVLPLAETASAGRWARFLYWRCLRGRRHLRFCDASLLKNYARLLERRLPELAVDAVFSPSTWLFAHAKTRLPIVFWTDACFAGMLDFYPSFTRVAPPCIRAGHLAEQRALNRCTRGIYCSEWAAQTVHAHYRVDPAKIGVIPFGGNLQEPPAAAEVAAAVRARDPASCRLLLVGVDWNRKGASIAVEATEVLRSRGLNARLTIVGCRPPWWVRLPESVEIVPFISKGTAEGRRRLDAFYKRSHFFIMPTRAEAYGLVFSEAGAFGVPCLATNVGGLRSVIRDEVNGRLFSLDATGSDYADYIQAAMRHTGRYLELALRSQAAAALHSWDIAGRRMAQILRETARPGRSASRGAETAPVGLAEP